MGLRLMRSRGEALLGRSSRHAGPAARATRRLHRKLVEQLGPTGPPLWRVSANSRASAPKTANSGAIRRTAKVQTDWLDSPQMRADLLGDAFDFATLKERRPRSISCCRRNFWRPTAFGCA